MQEVAFITIAGIIFGFVCCLHLARLIFTLEVSIGGWIVPMWISGPGFVVAGLLALWAGFIVFSGTA